MSLVSQTRGFIFLYSKFSRPSSIKPMTACLYKPLKRYGQEASEEDNISSSLHHERHERAPSTAEEFERFAEERSLRAADHGQTSEKVYDEEATVGDSKLDSVKNRLKEHEEGPDYRKKGDE